MPFAATLRLDAESAAQVEAIWTAFTQRGISNSARRLGYPPHVTLAVCDDKADQAKLAESVRSRAAAWSSVGVTCAALGVFADPPVTLFLVVTPTQPLLKMQADLCQALPQEQLHPHYHPGSWLPHVTVADDLQPARVPAAMAAACAAFRPFAATLFQVDLVRFRPVKLLWQAPLDNPEA